jgi:hypothetical protein
MSQDEDVFRGLGTLALHAGQVPDPTTTARAVPIYATTSYVFHDTEHAANLFGLREFGNIYTRLMNPTTDVLEKRLAALDGGAAGLALSSGQVAITAALLTIVHCGQNFVSANSLYGGTWTLFTQTFSKLGVEVRIFDPSKPESLSKLVDEDTRALYIETPGNPTNDVPDYQKITSLARGPLPKVRTEWLHRYYEYLTASLSLPFDAEYAEDVPGHRVVISPITVVALVHPDGHANHEGLGLVCRAHRGTQEIELPLSEVELNESAPSYRLVEDYWYWYWNWRFDPQI